MKPSLWFEVSMLALILIVSLIYVAASESEHRHLASGNGKTAQLQTPANYPITNSYL
jgi:hypothetical protein